MTNRKILSVTFAALAIIAVFGAVEINSYLTSAKPAPLEATHVSDSVTATISKVYHEDTPVVYDNSIYKGVVTYTVKDNLGNVKAVYVSHNTRTVQGINCLEQFVFNGLSTGSLNTNGTNVCGFQGTPSLTSAKFNGFRFIGLINGSSGSGAVKLNGSDTYTLSKIGGSRASSADGIISVGLTNQGSPANSTVAGTSTYNQLTITSPAFSFAQLASAGTTIRGAVLLNATSGTPAMFAENAFTGVTLANTDTLTISWTITVS